MTKKELIRIVPNHGVFVCSRAYTIQFGYANHPALLHEITRDGSRLWIDIEFDDGYGRRLLPWIDLCKEEIKYIYDCVTKTLATQHRSK